MSIDRRKFLKIGGLCAGAVFLNSCSSLIDQTQATPPISINPPTQTPKPQVTPPEIEKTPTKNELLKDQIKIEITIADGEGIDILPFSYVEGRGNCDWEKNEACYESNPEGVNSTAILYIHGWGDENARSLQLLSWIEKKGKSSPQEAETKLKQLVGSTATIHQNNKQVDLVISDAGRITQENMDIYEIGSTKEMLEVAGIKTDAKYGRLILVTCGFTLPGESGSSRYLIEFKQVNE